MRWLSKPDVIVVLLNRWMRGDFLCELVDGVEKEIFPLRISLHPPTSKEVAEKFNDVVDWALKIQESGLEVEYEAINNRSFGRNRIPVAIVFNTIDEVAAILKRGSELSGFRGLVGYTRVTRPEVMPWLARNPMVAVGRFEIWKQLLSVASWFMANPRPNIYARQVVVPGIDTKFIENHRALLGSILSEVLPASAIDQDATGTIAGFYRRFGLKSKPIIVRFRSLDEHKPALPQCRAGEVAALEEGAFARLDPPVANVFIVENEINFLSFPPVPNSMIIFGEGYGFEHIRNAGWLRDRRVLYWGDLDTHGFAILSQARSWLPHAESILMDMVILEAHLDLAGDEKKVASLPCNLTADEETAFNRLSLDEKHLRLEQEWIGFEYVEDAIRRLGQGGESAS